MSSKILSYFPWFIAIVVLSLLVVIFIFAHFYLVGNRVALVCDGFDVRGLVGTVSDNFVELNPATIVYCAGDVPHEEFIGRITVAYRSIYMIHFPKWLSVPFPGGSDNELQQESPEQPPQPPPRPSPPPSN